MSDDDAPPLDPALDRLLSDPAVWAEAPPDLRARTLAAATGAPLAAPAPAGRDEPRAVAGGRAHPAWGRRVLLVAAAVVVLGLVGVAGLRLARGTAPGGTQVALAGTEAAPGAHATARLRDEPAGVSVGLDAGGLPPAPDGTFYEVWLVGKDTKVSAGTFHRRGDQDTIKLWLGVDPAGYDAITVTRQPVTGGTPAPGVVVLRGELPGR